MASARTTEPGSIGSEQLAPETLAIHAGQRPDPVHGAVMQPIVLSSTFAQPEPGKPLRFDYSRSGNPTRAALEACLCELEGGRFAFAFASGCAAATTLLLSLTPGDHVVSGDDVYGGTHRLFQRVLSPLNVQTTFVDPTSTRAIAEALTPRTRLVWLESPSNPLLKLADIEAAAQAAHLEGAKLVVDNTFASPLLQNPLRLGADVVLHSTTKYINGHSDVVGGALITRDEALAERLKFLQNAVGAVPSPFDCYLILRGLKTLPVRMQRHVETARILAERLESHPLVSRVHYPGLSSHPQHELANRQMRGPGGIISVELSTGLEGTTTFLKDLHLFQLAESLGGVESLAEHPALMTHASLPPELRTSLGIGDSLVRLSVGLEHVEDLWHDLERALKVGATR